MDVLDFPSERLGSAGPTGAAPCRHERLELGTLVADVCPETFSVSWSGNTGPVDPAEAVARLFGDFDLRSAAPALHAPGRTTVICTPASRRGRSVLDAVPTDRWLEAMPSLWMRAADGVLLLSPTDDGLTGRLLRRLR